MKKGVLIVLVGIDGCGKTTQAKMLAAKLESNCMPVRYAWCRWKPFLFRSLINGWKSRAKKNQDSETDAYDSAQSKKRELLKSPSFRLLWLVAFSLEYSVQIFFKVVLSLIAGKIVISDRLFYDSFVDQSINLGMTSTELCSWLSSLSSRLLFPRPDIVIYLSCPPEVAYARKNDAPSINYLKERQIQYTKLASELSWAVVDATRSVDATASEIESIVRSGTKSIN